MFHAIEQMLIKETQQLDCSRRSNSHDFRPAMKVTTTSQSTSSVPDDPTVSPAIPTNRTIFPEAEDTPEGSTCLYAGQSAYRHCGMFGDPHLRTFSDNFYTCSVEGSWPLVDNDYLVVMATNVPVMLDSKATITTKVSFLVLIARVTHYCLMSELI